MKKVFNILIIFFLVLLLTGCKKELTSEGVSKLTYYVTFELVKGSLVINPKGTAYVDPGYKAMEGITEVTNKVTVDGTVNVNKVGIYELTYRATNSDGFSASVSRTVIVYDPAAPATDLTGNYLSNVSRVSPARAFNGLSVVITKKAPGFFYVSDFLGGFYDQGSNYRYGPAFALTGYMTLNPDNSLSYVSSYNAGWRDSANSLTNGVYNPATNGLSWRVSYTSSNYIFNITLTRI
jgi:hypothetical protein